MQKEIEYYESLDELWLYNWSQFMETNDNNWFIKGYDGRQPRIQNEYLDALTKRLQDEHYKLTLTNQAENDLHNWGKLNQLVARHTRICTILIRIEQGFGEDNETRLKFILALAKEGFRIPQVNTYAGDLEEVQKCFDALGQIRNQIALIEAELKTDEKKKTNEKQSLSKQLKMVSVGLELGFPLKPKEITVVDWIDYCGMLEEKSKSLSEI